MNAEGSALRENETQLDSIEGKIAQFKNELQIFWNSLIDSEWIKQIVDLGTGLLQIINKLGSLRTVLLSIAAISMIKHRTGPIEFFKTIIEKGNRFIENKVSYVKGLKDTMFATNELSSATTKLTQAELKDKLTSAGLTDAMAEKVVAKTNLGKATDELSDSTLEAALRESGYNKAQRDSIVQTVFNTKAAEDNADAKQDVADASNAAGVAAEKESADIKENQIQTEQNSQSKEKNTQENIENAASSEKSGAAKDKETADIKENSVATEQNSQSKEKNTQANNKNAVSSSKSAKSLSGLWGSVKSFAKQNASMLITLGVSLAIAGINKLVDALVDTMDELQDEFDDAANALSSLASELENLESQLADINSQIDEINNSGTLSFTDQEELSRLKDQSAELQRQIDLTTTLKEQQAGVANDAALNAAQKYSNVGIDSGKTTGERTGDAVKTTAAIGLTATGAATMAALSSAATAAAAAGTAMSWNPVGWALLIGAGITAAVTAVVGGITYVAAESEEKVGESIENMRERYTQFTNEFNAARDAYMADPDSKGKQKKYDKAKEALEAYQSSMADYMSQNNSYYAQIKANWDQASDEAKAWAKEWEDYQDKNAILNNGANAKTNAIDRLFGKNAEGNFAKARGEIDKIKERLKEAKEAEDEVAIAAVRADLKNFSLDGILSDEDIARLREMGIYLYEAEDHLNDVVEAESEFIDGGLEDVAKDVDKITDGLGALKSAFEEVVEKGALSAKTVLSLKESLELETTYKDVEGVNEAWNDYLKDMMSGVATTEEMTEATEEFATILVKAAIAKGELDVDNKWEYVVQLKMLGVTNAEEFINDLLQENNMVNEINDGMTKALEDVSVADVAKVVSEASGGVDMRGDVSMWSDEELEDYAVKHGLVDKTLTEEHKQEIAERYGADIEAIDAIIVKLNELDKLERQKTDLGTQEKAYNKWLEAYNKAYENLQLAKTQNSEVDFEAAKKQYDEVMAAKNKLAEIQQLQRQALLAINTDQEDAALRAFNDAQDSSGFYNTEELQYEFNGEVFWSTDEFMIYLNDLLYEIGPEFVALQTEFENLWSVGEKNGYIVDGEIVDPDYEKQLNDVDEKVKAAWQDIQDNLTLEAKIEMGLIDPSQVVDEIQSVYDTLNNAVNEYNETGKFSVDAFQSILDLGPEYLSLLSSENGQLKLNKEAIEELTRARLRYSAIDKIDSFMEDVKTLVGKGEFEKISNLFALSDDATAELIDVDAYMRSFDEMFENADISDDAKESLRNNFKKYIEGISQGLEDVELEVEAKVDIHAEIDGLQSAYSALTDAVAEYNEKGFMSLDNLQALISLEPQYLACLQMENGQLKINREAMMSMLQAQLLKGRATIVENAILQLNALSEKARQGAIENATGAMVNANPTLEKYAGWISTVGQEAVITTGKLNLLAEATGGAIAAGVSEDDVRAVWSGMDAILQTYEDTYTQLPTNWDQIVNPSSGSGSGSDEDPFQKEMKYWENLIGVNQKKYELIQNRIDLLEKQGKIVVEDYYKEQIRLEEERKSLLEQQQEAAKKMLGTFAEGSDEWWTAANQISDLEVEIDSVTASIQDLKDAIDQIHWDIFDETHERFGDLTEQLETVRGLLSVDEDSFFDKAGEWTETGVAVLGTYVQELEIYKSALSDVNNELANLSIDDFDSEQEYYDKLTELTEQQHEYAKAVSDAEQSVVDMYESQIDAIEDYTDELVDSYNDYIDVVKEALDAERDLYDFKRKIEDQSSDIAETERKIAALSGSTDAEDIAERRKLEKTLYEQKRDMDDSYRDQARKSQDEALDNESKAYEQSMKDYIKTLREKLDEAKRNMDSFMGQVTAAVTTNAGIVLEQYQSTGIQMSIALTQPWQDAADKIAEFGGAEGALAAMNNWTKAGESGFVYNFSVNATSQLTSPWSAAEIAVDTFKSTTAAKMGEVVSNIQTNVATATGELNKIKELYAEINGTTLRAPSTGGGGGTGGGSGNTTTPTTDQPKTPLPSDASGYLTADTKVQMSPQYVDKNGNIYYKVNGYNAYVSAGSTTNRSGVLYAVEGSYIYTASTKGLTKKVTTGGGVSSSSMLTSGVNSKVNYAMYAQGTLGTDKDGLAITDESWIGDEITLAAGKNGQLQYLKKGSAVLPADISANLVEWGKLNPDMLNIGGTPNLNMINNAVNKPELKLDIENFLRCDNVSQDSLPELKKFVNEQMNSLIKQLNYSLKKSGAR